MSLWTGILDAQRATDWDAAGSQHVDDIRANCVTAACNTLNGGTVTTTSIANAIASAPADTVVRIPAGNFTGIGGILINRSRITVRGAGAMSTKLTFNGTPTTQCGWFLTGAVVLCPGSPLGIGSGLAQGGTDPDQSVTWIAGYAQGTTVITLGSGAGTPPSGLTARSGNVPGTIIYLDQLDDASDGFPATGDVFMCRSGADSCSWEGAGSSAARASRTLVEPHEVIGISGLNITIDPPIRAPLFRAGQSPGAWWDNDGNVVKSSGIENLTIDATNASGSNVSSIYAVQCHHCWQKGVRTILNRLSSNFTFHQYLLQTHRFTIRDSYSWGPIINPDTSQRNTNYVYTDLITGSILYENNIFHNYLTGPAPDDPTSGNVIGYNYSDGGTYTGDFQPHNAGDAMNLYEGNNVGLFWGDNIHGTHHFNTLFRNHFDYLAHNGGSAAENGGILLHSHNRFYNLIGNVIGHSSLSPYQTINASTGTPIFMLGYQGSHGGSGPANDCNVQRTLMRWGNWDSVNNGTRFVVGENAAGPTTPAIGVCGASTIPNFPGLASPSQTFPPSFYRSAKPTAWWNTPWGEPPWPPIGPDVTGGPSDAALGGNTRAGGHAYKIPARLCFENIGNDSAYSGSSPPIKAFDAATCYIASVATPTKLAMILR